MLKEKAVRWREPARRPATSRASIGCATRRQRTGVVACARPAPRSPRPLAPPPRRRPLRAHRPRLGRAHRDQPRPARPVYRDPRARRHLVVPLLRALRADRGHNARHGDRPASNRPDRQTDSGNGRFGRQREGMRNRRIPSLCVRLRRASRQGMCRKPRGPAVNSLDDFGSRRELERSPIQAN